MFVYVHIMSAVTVSYLRVCITGNDGVNIV